MHAASRRAGLRAASTQLLSANEEFHRRGDLHGVALHFIRRRRQWAGALHGGKCFAVQQGIATATGQPRPLHAAHAVYRVLDQAHAFAATALCGTRVTLMTLQMRQHLCLPIRLRRVDHTGRRLTGAVLAAAGRLHAGWCACLLHFSACGRRLCLFALIRSRRWQCRVRCLDGRGWGLGGSRWRLRVRWPGFVWLLQWARRQISWWRRRCARQWCHVDHHRFWWRWCSQR